MHTITIQKSTANKQVAVQITGSKSESNRLLLLQALYPELRIENLSKSDDSQLMGKALSSKSKVIDIHHAGTAMRFLTAFFSTQEGAEIEITGSSRMKERPIKILVEALNQLGAEIIYKEQAGYPPLIIKGRKITKHEVGLDANVSSQYISALLLVAPKLENGLALTLKGKITSMPYINMTLNLLNQIGVETCFESNVISVSPLAHKLKSKTIVVESDWSSASYYYSIVALSEMGTTIELSSYKKDSLQGDSALSEIYKAFGVETRYDDTTVILQKSSVANQQLLINFELSNSPDIAQTIAVTAFALGLKCDLSGLHTLKIKETDRLIALKKEIEKLGGEVHITADSLSLKSSSCINENIAISTYNDHRMAMAFAPLALKVPIVIEEASVVSKSYPTFWDDLKSIGFQFKK